MKSHWRFVLLSILGASGTPVPHLAAQFPIFPPRFESDVAAARLRRPRPPVLQSPSGIITAIQPSYVWTAVATAADYYLRVNGPSGSVLSQWCGAAEVFSGFTTAKWTGLLGSRDLQAIRVSDFR